MVATDQLTILAITAILLLPSAAFTAKYTVGDSSGWTINFNYTRWAADKTFYVGDTLVFNYDPALHYNVFKISTPEAFKNCDKPDPKLALTTWKDLITLATPGKKWYICDVAVHCAQFNQKLTITVMDAPAPSTEERNTLHSSFSSAFTAVASTGFPMVATAVAATFMF